MPFVQPNLTSSINHSGNGMGRRQWWLTGHPCSNNPHWNSKKELVDSYFQEAPKSICITPPPSASLTWQPLPPCR